VATDRQRNFEFVIVLPIIWKKPNRRHPQQGVLLMSLKSGGLHEKLAVFKAEARLNNI
jgi:hypothetical protein